MVSVYANQSYMLYINR